MLSCSGVCMYQWSHVKEDGFSRVVWPPKKRLMMAVKALSAFTAGSTDGKLDVASVFKTKKETKSVHFAAKAAAAAEASPVTSAAGSILASATAFTPAAAPAAATAPAAAPAAASAAAPAAGGAAGAATAPAATGAAAPAAPAGGATPAAAPKPVPEPTPETKIFKERIEVDRGGVNGDLFALLHNARLDEIAPNLADAGFETPASLVGVEDVKGIVKTLGLKKPQARRFKKVITACEELCSKEEEEKGKEETGEKPKAGSNDTKKEMEKQEQKQNEEADANAKEQGDGGGEAKGDGSEEEGVAQTAKEEAADEEIDLEAIANQVTTELGETES